MSSPPSQGSLGERKALELIEEGVWLLRANPELLLLYYLGTLPYMLGLLYFWADMSRSAYAGEYLGPAALGLALLHVWMKTFQAIYATRVYEVMGLQAPSPWGISRIWMLACRQSLIHSIGTFAIPIGLLLTIPFVVVFTFFQNVLVQPAGVDLSLSQIRRRATRQALLWPRQNHVLLMILTAFGFFVLLNIAMTIYLIPQLLKMLFDIDSSVVESHLFHLLNTTYLAVLLALAYICVDPLIKACYALRCFYGDSVESGEDIRSIMRGRSLAIDQTPEARPKSSNLRLAGLCCFAALIFMGQGHAQQPDSMAPIPNPTAQNVSPSTLDQSMQEVLKLPLFTWRMPREGLPAPEEAQPKGWIGRFFDSVDKGVKSIGRAIQRQLKKLGKWIESLLERSARRKLRDAEGGYDLSQLTLHITYVAVVFLCGILAWLATVLWRRRSRAPVIVATPLPARPDLMREDISASELPEEGWLRMARECLDRGDTRLALRACYLASLSSLADRQVLTLRPSKSNRDYQRELERRAHAQKELASLFRENVIVIERVWYGNHEPVAGQFEEFFANHERMASLAAQV